MTPEQREDLKQAALKATPGPWDFDTAETPYKIAGGEVVGGDALPWGAVYTTAEYETPDGTESLVVASEIGCDNGRFVARANPAAILSLIAQVEALTLRAERAERALVRGGFVDHGAQEWKPPIGPAPKFIEVEALTVPQWISVETALPKCSKKPNSLGVEVIVYPQPEKGESTAFFGCRVTDKPGFYKYGHVVKGVTHWMYVPTIPAIPRTKDGA